MALTYTYIHYIDPLLFLAFGLPRLISAFFSFIMNFFIYKAGTRRVDDNESSRLLKKHLYHKHSNICNTLSSSING
ncbi:MAG: hypothetical protein ACTSUX_00705 [Promethearchaeota archaeon]